METEYNGLDIDTDGINTTEGLYSERSDDELGLGGTLKDIGLGLGRGLIRAGQEFYDLTDWITQDDLLPDSGDWNDALGLGNSKTLVGGLVEGITQFATGFIPGFGAIGAIGKAAKLGSLATKLKYAAKSAKLAGRAREGVAVFKIPTLGQVPFEALGNAITLGAGFGKATTAGAIADFAVFDPHEERLSNLINRYPALSTPITEFLASDPNDTEMEGRLKNLLEGAALGGIIEPFIVGLRTLRAVRKGKREGKSLGEIIGLYGHPWEEEAAREVTGESAARFEDVQGRTLLGGSALPSPPVDVPLQNKANSNNQKANERHGNNLLDAAQREVDEISEAAKGEDISDDAYFSSPADEGEVARFDAESKATPNEFTSKDIWENERRSKVEASLDRRGIEGDLKKGAMELAEDFIENGLGVSEDGHVLLYHQTDGHFAKMIRSSGEIPTSYKPTRGDVQGADSRPIFGWTTTRPASIQHDSITRQLEGGKLPPPQTDAVIRVWAPLEHVQIKEIGLEGEAPRQALFINILDAKGNKLPNLPVTVQSTTARIGAATKEARRPPPRKQGPAAQALEAFEAPIKKAHSGTGNIGSVMDQSDKLKWGELRAAAEKERADAISDAVPKAGREGAKKAPVDEGARPVDVGAAPTGVPVSFISKATAAHLGQEGDLIKGTLIDASNPNELKIRTEDGKVVTVTGDDTADIIRQARDADPDGMGKGGRGLNEEEARLNSELAEQERRTGVKRDDLDTPEGDAGYGLPAEQLRQLKALDTKHVSDAELNRLGLTELIGTNPTVERVKYEYALSILKRERMGGGDVGAPAGERLKSWKAAADESDGGKTSSEGGSGKGPDDTVTEATPDPKDPGGPRDQTPAELRTPGEDPLTRGVGPKRSEGSAVFKWDNFLKSARLAIKLVINSAPNEVRDALKDGYKVLTREELEEKVRQTARMNKEMGVEDTTTELEEAIGGLFGPHDIKDMALHDRIQDIVVMQNYVRTLVQEYSKLTKDLFTKANDSKSLEDAAAFHIVSMMAETVSVINRQNQAAIGQLFKSQQYKPQHLFTHAELLKNISILESAEGARAFVSDLGAGNMDLGMQIMAQRRKRYFAAVEANNGDLVAGTAFLVKKHTLGEKAIEYWMNAILSGPTTMAVNATSNAINTLALPIEKLAGGILTADRAEIRQAMSIFHYLFEQSREALKAAAIAFKTEEDKLDPMFRTIEYGAGTKSGQSSRALSSENPVLDYVGQTLNLPTRLLLTTDVFFRALNFRAMAKTSLFEEAITGNNHLGRELIGQEAREYVGERFNKLIMDGEFYNYKNVHNSVSKQAVQEASDMGLVKEDEINKYVSKRIYELKNTKSSTSFDESLGSVADKAIKYAREATWTQALHDPERHGLVQFFGSFQRIGADWPMFRLIVPFVRTPTNLIAHALDRTIGAYFQLSKKGYNKLQALKAQDKEVISQLAAEGPAKAELMGKIATGSAIMTTGYIAYANGVIQGGGPADKELNAVWRAAGNLPYSLKIGDKRYEFRRMDPWAPLFGLICDLSDGINFATSDDDKEILEGMSLAALVAVSRSITSRVVLTGLARFTNVLSDPERYGSSWMEQSLTSVGPFSGAAGQILAAKELSEIRSVTDAIRVKYGLTGNDSNNFFGERVEPQFTALGDRVDRAQREPWAPMVGWKLSEGRKNQDIYEELDNIHHGLQSYGKTRKGHVLEDFTNESGISAEQRANELMTEVRINGLTLPQSLRKLFRSNSYKRISPEFYAAGKSPRVELVRRVHRTFKEAVWPRLKTEIPELKSADRKLTRIKNLYARGIDIPEELLESIQQ